MSRYTPLQEYLKWMDPGGFSLTNFPGVKSNRNLKEGDVALCILKKSVQSRKGSENIYFNATWRIIWSIFIF